MVELSDKHSAIKQEFRASHLTIHKTKYIFSAIPIYQAHEQTNAHIKGDSRAVRLTDNPSTFHHWMIAGTAVFWAIEEFEATRNSDTKLSILYHDQTPSIQKKCLQDVQSWVLNMKDFGNPFELESKDLLMLDTKVIFDPSVVATVQNILVTGQKWFDDFNKNAW